MEIINAQNVSILIFFTGFAGLLIKRHVLKSVICIGLMQAAIILFFLSGAFAVGGVPPIGASDGVLVADPLPQALMLTEIVIGVGVTATALTLFIHLYHRYGTNSWVKIALKRKDKS